MFFFKHVEGVCVCRGGVSLRKSARAHPTPFSLARPPHSSRLLAYARSSPWVSLPRFRVFQSVPFYLAQAKAMGNGLIEGSLNMRKWFLWCVVAVQQPIAPPKSLPGEDIFPPKSLCGRYKFVRYLGSGSYGFVCEARDIRTGEAFRRQNYEILRLGDYVLTEDTWGEHLSSNRDIVFVWVWCTWWEREREREEATAGLKTAVGVRYHPPSGPRSLPNPFQPWCCEKILCRFRKKKLFARVPSNGDSCSFLSEFTNFHTLFRFCSLKHLQTHIGTILSA